MKLRCIILLLVMLSLHSYAQTGKVLDFKVKTAANSKDRTEMLDALRSHLHDKWKLEFVFDVNYFKVGNNYAWFTGEAERKDGKKIVFTDDVYDCCHVEALFQKKNGKWAIAASGAFSTDVWYDGLDKKYPDAPELIFPKELRSR